jgi:hypothetical protein
MLTLISSKRNYQASALKKLAFDRIQMTADVRTSLQLVMVDLSCDDRGTI